MKCVYTRPRVTSKTNKQTCKQNNSFARMHKPAGTATTGLGPASLRSFVASSVWAGCVHEGSRTSNTNKQTCKQTHNRTRRLRWPRALFACASCCCSSDFRRPPLLLCAFCLRVSMLSGQGRVTYKPAFESFCSLFLERTVLPLSEPWPTYDWLTAQPRAAL